MNKLWHFLLNCETDKKAERHSDRHIHANIEINRQDRYTHMDKQKNILINSKSKKFLWILATILV